MKTLYKTLAALTLLFVVSGCSSLSSLPGIEPDGESQSTPQAQANDQDNDSEGYDDESDLIDPGCHMEHVYLVVDYDHRWVWSPDGTANTGSYIGTAKGTVNFLLANDGQGTLAADTSTIFFSQEGEIQGDPDKCTIKDGRGSAEMTVYGTCNGGVIELEWLEAQTDSSEATMVCGDKTVSFGTYHPLQLIMVFQLGDDGWGYKQSNSTAVEGFRDVSMEWTFRYVPEGQKE